MGQIRCRNEPMRRRTRDGAALWPGHRGGNRRRAGPDGMGKRHRRAHRVTAGGQPADASSRQGRQRAVPDDQRALGRLPPAGPGTRPAGRGDPARAAAPLARNLLYRIRAAALAVREGRRGGCLHLVRIRDVHAGLRSASRHNAGVPGLHRRRDRPGHHHAADRLPAHPVRGVQPEGNRGCAAERPRRCPVVGPGVAGPYALRARFGVSTIDTMPGLYAQWERWAADVAESHTTYLPLVRFRSPSRSRPG